MKKDINSIFYSLVVLLVISIIVTGACQLFIIKNNDAYLTSEEMESLGTYIQTTTDLEALRKKSVILFESNTEYVALMNNAFKFARDTAAILSFVLATLCFYAFRLKSKFLTSS